MACKYIYITGDYFISKDDHISPNDIFSCHFDNGDILTNLEGSIGNGTPSKFKAVPLKLNPNVVNNFKSNIYFSLVNNHICDFGSSSFFQACDKIGSNALFSLNKEIDPRKKVGSTYFLFFGDSKEGCPNNKIGFLNFDFKTVTKYRKFIKDSFVVIHGGIEYRKYPTPYQRALSKRIVDSGALGIFFHHSHMVGMCEKYNGILICYGLGNFYFSRVGQLHGLGELDGMIARVDTHSSEIFLSLVKYNIDSNARVSLELDFSPADTFCEPLPDKDYKIWYATQYPLEPSFRPRQLECSDFIVSFKFHLWQLLALPLIYFGISKKIKKSIGKFISTFK